MAILVTGGAGYIGSVMVELLGERGEQVVVLDDVARGHARAVAEHVPFYQGRTGDRALVARICTEHEIEACIHFAALAYVGESVTDPKRYFENNVAQGIALLDALLAAGVRRFVFSSTCATYGEPLRVPIGEQHTQQMIEARKVVHVRMRDKDMREAHQLARWQHVDVAEVEQQRSPLVTKIDIQPRIAEYIIARHCKRLQQHALSHNIHQQFKRHDNFRSATDQLRNADSGIRVHSYNFQHRVSNCRFTRHEPLCNVG